MASNPGADGALVGRLGRLMGPAWQAEIHSLQGDCMIDSFRHRGLRRLFEDDDRSKLPPDQVARLRLILTAPDVAERIEDMNIHSFRQHALKGDLQGFWTMTVRANWRVIFRFSGRRTSDIDLVDYY